MKLQKITYDEQLTEFDLSRTTPCDDRLMTKLTLDDYDWMEYTFESWFPTRAQGFLHICVIYAGTVRSEMQVEQTINDKVYKHSIIFATDIFVDFIKDYMTKHLAQWDSEHAFCGEREAVEFYNKILDNAVDHKYEEIHYRRKVVDLQK